MTDPAMFAHHRDAGGPMVTAHAHTERPAIELVGHGVVRQQLGVSVEVDYGLGDHLDALAALTSAVADVRRQIADAAERST